MEMQKQMFGKQMFAGTSLSMGHRQDFDQMTWLSFFPIKPS